MKTLARARDREELLRRLRTLRPDSARRWGRMSAPQMVCHLGDCFRMALAERPVSPARPIVPRIAAKWIALYLPLRWPAGLIPTRPEIDPQRGGTPPAAFAADLVQVEALLDRVVTASRTMNGHLHPMFGRMSEAEWLRWGYLHTDHHLRQFGA